jgi:hypothetical protein
MTPTKRKRLAQPNAATFRQLVVVRQLFNAGVSQAQRAHDPSSRLLAVVVLDVSVESALHASVASLDPRRTPANTFGGLLAQTETLLVNAGVRAVPGAAKILQVHSIRNDAQHRARVPLDAEVTEAVAHVREYLRELVQLVWGLTLERVSLVETVKEAEVREHLRLAEDARSKRRFRRATSECAIALALALGKVRRAVVGGGTSFARGFVMEDDLRRFQPGQRGSFPAFSDGRDVFRSFQRMQDALLVTALGINLGDYVRFRAVAGDAVFFVNNRVEVQHGKDRVSEAQTDICLAFATESVLEVENRAGDLDRPFGRDYWV